jgi:hypothetical protein
MILEQPKRAEGCPPSPEGEKRMSRGARRENRFIRRSLAGLLLLAFGGCAMFVDFLPDRPGLLVPFYTYPDRSWDLLVEARMSHPQVPIVAIVNPASGPGKTPDPNYVEGIAKLQRSGVTVIGYVATSYARKDPAAVNEEVDLWQAWYRVDGIFYDEMAYEPGGEAYYRALGRHARSKGLGLTVGNPGTGIPESYVGTFDTIVIYEDAGLPDVESLGGWHSPYGRRRWAILPHSVKTLDRSFVKDASRRVGLIGLTDLQMPDPWDHLPSYLKELVAALDESR